jgi:hypothetical protein
MVIGTKLFACVLLAGVCSLYDPEFDARLLAMAISAAAMGNIPIIFHVQDFENNHVSWLKNLPVTRTNRFAWFMILLIALVLPEGVVLTNYAPQQFNWPVLMMSFLYLLSIGALLWGLLHRRGASIERFTRTSFAIFILLIVLILFKVPLWLITATNVGTGFLLYRKFYYVFEPDSEGPT